MDNSNLKATQETLDSYKDPNNPERIGTTLTLETGDTSDAIHISQSADGRLSVNVNNQTYTFNGPPPTSDTPAKDKPVPFFFLTITTAGGNDSITLDPNVTATVTIHAGDGDDTVQAGSGTTTVYGGRGRDHIRLGSGAGYAEGNEGNDTLIGGTANVVMYGNDGKDVLYAGAGPTTKESYLDGGDGNDRLYAGNGHTVINGGKGNDRIVAHDDATIYTGKGFDRVWANGNAARIYAKNSDRLSDTEQSTITRVTPSDAGQRAFSIVGSDAFKQRVEDDLELLRASPAGRVMLEEMDKAADRNGAPVTIEQSDFINMYGFSTTELEKLNPGDRFKIPRNDSRSGVINNGVAGAAADQGKIFYYPSFSNPETNASPIVQFYHEMAHAWNGANGTFLSGSSDPLPEHPERPGPENAELQAIGLPTNAPPFDFDNDPSTPPTSTNPAPFTENALNLEMGKPPRTGY
ncbi:M91 family zinc metallopeptidase [Pseudomonas salmasensis]|uniref:M91 family zinc metallopeptidase n=1 Tax=Pseudomonas salmasensis TaxID=2745514 RepID=A0ABU5FAH7_9PSED|nr:M91 family zinc metallopeptidase [Pseudomonas salmasensis]MDY4299179.1 M91 family zinc metallopeptidase [Pseudomonas salmasensis]